MITAVVRDLLAFSVMDVETGEIIEFRKFRKYPKHKSIWDTSYANELGRLCQGGGKNPANPLMQRVKGTNTFRVVRYEDIPKDRRKISAILLLFVR